MFVYPRTIQLKDTDTTGSLYFTQQFQIAMEAFESFLTSRGRPLASFLLSDYLFPVVHAASDYKAPLHLGDHIEVSIDTILLGSSSVSMHYRFVRTSDRLEIGAVRIVHVLVDKSTGTSKVIPLELHALFSRGHQESLLSE